MTRKTIYFAGPLFTQAEWLWNGLLVEKLRDTFNVLVPQEAAEPMLSGRTRFDPRRLFRENLHSIERASAVVAVLDQADADSGTCWECGYAAARGIPVVGIRTDIRSTGDDKDLNLMLTQSCFGIVRVPLANRADVRTVGEEVTRILLRASRNPRGRRRRS